ncbi:MAG: FeoB-associated Cys-rich membrane protein [Desulfovibrionaceae bacterium]
MEQIIVLLIVAAAVGYLARRWFWPSSRPSNGGCPGCSGCQSITTKPSCCESRSVKDSKKSV